MDYIVNINNWKKYLNSYEGGSVWTDFLKSNKKRPDETLKQYRNRLSEDYRKNKQNREPILGKFDDIIERLDTIISKLNSPNYVPPVLPPAPPPMPQKREQETNIIIPKNLPKIDDSSEPIQVRMLNELKRKLAERNLGKGLDIIETPLNNEQIQNKVKCKFVLYENMHKINTINELLPKTLILYQLARVGHFCCVFVNDEGINFFDPLGFKPDTELKLAHGIIPYHDYSYLVKLFINSGKKIVYNNHKLQASGTSTCGHWCSLRMLYSNLSCDEFANIFKDVNDRDETIAKIFYNEI